MNRVEALSWSGLLSFKGFGRTVDRRLGIYLISCEEKSRKGNLGSMRRYLFSYLARDKDVKLYDYAVQHPSGVWPTGDIISTPSDLLQWLEALNEEDLLTPSMKAE